MKSASRARVLVCVAALLLAATVSFARPGGGNTYSGGSSSGGGDSSGSDGDALLGVIGMLEQIRRLLGLGVIPFYGLTIGVGFWINRQHELNKTLSFDFGGHVTEAPAIGVDRDDMLKRLRESDPDFSMIIFEDFATTLYIESQRARHDVRALSGLAPYWASAPLEALAEREPRGGAVDAVVVGMLHPEGVSEEGTHVRIRCWFEANLYVRKAEEEKGGEEKKSSPMTYFASEHWTFSRERSVKTKVSTGVRKLGCPNCGAPLATGADLRCPSCGEISGDGRFDWQVTDVVVSLIEARPHSFTGTSHEQGTDVGTRFAPFLMKRLDELIKADPALSAKSIEARLRLIFNTMQSAWSVQDLRPLRPLVSDRQHDALSYWIEAYRERGLRNVVENARLTKFVFVRVERDAHYDSITLRVWGSSLDYTVDQTGQVVGGSRTSEREYSEYWTLIRSASARGTPRLNHDCPGCGVHLTLNMAGLCEHCGVHVTSGEFDWVLSKIEQDEAYLG